MKGHVFVRLVDVLLYRLGVGVFGKHEGVIKLFTRQLFFTVYLDEHADKWVCAVSGKNGETLTQVFKTEVRILTSRR